MTADPAPERHPWAFRSFRDRYQERRDFDAGASWREWLRERYAKYWYGIGSFLLDGMAVGTILQNTDTTQPWPYLLSAAMAAGLVYLEVVGLRHFWPPKSLP